MTNVSSSNGARSGLIDTNAVILMARLDTDELPERPLISAVTLAELSVGPLIADDPREQAVRQVRLQDAEASYDPIPFDNDCARAYGAVVTSLRRAGRKSSARALDALIAATAIANGLPVYTCNPADFTGIDGLDVRPLTHPDNL
ncbi:MAG: type II toxin-antitoxin system VapC family toxin [Sporichthyaceae bacterium]